MSSPNLGKFERVPLRDAWIHEAAVFTKWLAEPDNLALLGEAIDLDITLVEIEASVGRYNVDILAQDSSSEKPIVIENQLEITNHDHLGKIITYASGLQANTIIWVVKSARDEHKEAVQWLNRHTDDEVDFFLIAIELWKIDDSKPAPRFQVIVAPNAWAKIVKHATEGSRELTDTKQMQFDFWTQFREFAQTRETFLKLRKVSPQHWYSISTGSSKWHIALTVNTSTNHIACEAYIPHAPDLFEKFESNRGAIEGEFGAVLEWMPLEGKQACRIKLSEGGDLTDTARWPDYFSWMLQAAETFHSVFTKYD